MSSPYVAPNRISVQIAGLQGGCFGRGRTDFVATGWLNWDAEVVWISNSDQPPLFFESHRTSQKAMQGGGCGQFHHILPSFECCQFEWLLFLSCPKRPLLFPERDAQSLWTAPSCHRAQRFLPYQPRDRLDTRVWQQRESFSRIEASNSEARKKIHPITFHLGVCS